MATLVNSMSQSVGMSRQGTIALAAYAILLGTVLIPIKGVPYNFGERMISIIVLLIPMLLSVYTVNCMVVGDSGTYCGHWAWFSAGIVMVWALLLLAATVYGAIYGVDSMSANMAAAVTEESNEATKPENEGYKNGNGNENEDKNGNDKKDKKNDGNGNDGDVVGASNGMPNDMANSANMV